MSVEIYHVYMQSIQKLNRFIFLFLYFTILFFTLFLHNKETKNKIDLTFESIACNGTESVSRIRKDIEICFGFERIKSQFKLYLKSENCIQIYTLVGYLSSPSSRVSDLSWVAPFCLDLYSQSCCSPSFLFDLLFYWVSYLLIPIPTSRGPFLRSQLRVIEQF